MSKFLILVLFFISYKTMANEYLRPCQQENKLLEHRLKPCKTELEAIKTNLLNVNKSKKLYWGKPITLEAQDIEANLLFLNLADFSDYSLIMDADFNKEISIKKTEVPWDQALDKIAEFLDLKAKIFNSIIYVDKPTSLRKYKPRKKSYNGSTLALDFHNIKARVLFNVLAGHSGNALLIDANINKKISIKRNNVPWDQVLDELAEFLDLKAKVVNGIIYVDTPLSLWKYKHREKKYQGGTFSLNLLSIKISDLFDIIAEFSGNSFVLATDINQKINSEISIKRDKTPWDQVLDEITEFLNLKTKISNGVIYVEDNETFKHHNI